MTSKTGAKGAGRKLPSPVAVLAHLWLGEGPYGTRTIVVPLEPVPASRPRIFRNGGRSYAKTYVKWREEFDAMYADTFTTQPKGPLVAIIEHVRKRPKSTKREWPRGDFDNLDKAILDGAQRAGMIADDDAVVGAIVNKRYTKPGESPHTLIMFVWRTDEKPA